MSVSNGRFGSPRPATVSVLVIDDDPAMVCLLQAVFKRHGDSFSVIGSASGGFEGLRLWAQRRPDVLELDLSMPDLGGHEVMQRIHQSDPGQAIVLFSAHIDETTTTNGSLQVPKNRIDELPGLIQQWLSPRNSMPVCPGASPPRSAG
jgi:CheY-like chemotaxis protein